MSVIRPVILMAMANDPQGSLRLKEEERGVRDTLAEAHEDERLEFLPLGFTTLDDLFDTINRKHRDLVIFHFCGHSDGKGLQLEEPSGSGENSNVSKSSISTLLGQEPHLKLAFLNGCANKEQVDILHQRGVKNVIATSALINDEKALHFSINFYESLVSGKSIRDSFDTAVAFIKEFDPNLEVANRGGFNLFNPTSDHVPWGLYSIDDTDQDWHLPLPEQLDETIASPTAKKFAKEVSLDETVARPKRDMPGSTPVKGVKLTTNDSRVENNEGVFFIADEQILGRSHECDIVILDMKKTVSRKHAKIHQKNGRMWITDLDSSNGTYWNDERITQMPIFESGILRLDNCEFQVELIT